MAGSHHSARQPTRLSSIGRRTARAVGDRRRVSEADLRRAIYVRPLGRGYHVVKNVCNDQEYVVADATNSTFRAGQVVSLGSFTGNPGEFVLGKPPAGFGGSSAFAIQRVNAGFGVATTPDDSLITLAKNFLPYCCAWDAFAGGVLIPADHATSINEVTHTYTDLLLFDASDLPISVADLDTETRYTRVASIESGGDYLVIGIASAPGPRRCILVYDASVSYASGLAYRFIWFDSDGDAADIGAAWNGPDWFVDMGTPHTGFCLAGGSLYALVPDDDPSGDGSPPLSMYRIVRMDYGSATEQAAYSIPSVTPYQGSSTSGQVPFAITPVAGGGVWLWLRSGAATPTYWRQLFDSSLSPSGSPVQITGFGAATYYASYSMRRMVAQRSSADFLVYGTKVGSGIDFDLFVSDGVSVTGDIAVDVDVGVALGSLQAVAYRPDGQTVIYLPTSSGSVASILYVDSGGTLHSP